LLINPLPCHGGSSVSTCSNTTGATAGNHALKLLLLAMEVRACQHVLLLATFSCRCCCCPVSSLSSSIYSYAKTCIFSPIECVGSRERKKIYWWRFVSLNKNLWCA
jgi:hypothetical protein